MIISITLVFAAIAYAFAIKAKPTYQASVALVIDRVPTQRQTEVGYYQYDNFYSSAVAANLAANMVDWMGSASTVTQIFNKAGYPLPTTDVKGLSKIFTVAKKQEASSVVSVVYGSSDREQADRIISSTTEVLKEKVDDFNKNDGSAKFTTFTDQPVVIEAPKQISLNVIIAAFLGFVISLGIISIREALK